MPTSSTTEQLSHLASLSKFPVAVLALAPDSIRLQRLCEHLLSLASKTTEDRQSSSAQALKKITAADLNKQSWKSMKEELGALSLFSSNSFFIISNIEKLPLEIARDLIDFIPSIPFSTHLILLGSSLPASHVLLKHFRTVKCLVELEELKGSALKRWVQKELRQQGGFTQGEAMVVDILIDLGDGSPDKISRLISLLSLYCDSERALVAHIRSLFSDKTHANEFQLVDAISRGDQKTMLFELSQSLRGGKSPLSILGLISKNLITLLNIKALQQAQVSDSRIKDRLGIPDWLYRKYSTNSRYLDLKRAKKACAAILRADS
ncbi:MAG: DNA polymerase III subunit delta, partial [SAR324 cluster bacterium]|nr:DNA polymerase III subunit delta [SAR324 cluster bacterium]